MIKSFLLILLYLTFQIVQWVQSKDCCCEGFGDCENGCYDVTLQYNDNEIWENYIPMNCSCANCPLGYFFGCEYVAWPVYDMVCACVPTCIMSKYCVEGCQWWCPKGRKCDRNDLYKPRDCPHPSDAHGGVYQPDGAYYYSDCPLNLCEGGYYCERNSMTIRGHKLEEGTFSELFYDHTCCPGYFCRAGSYNCTGAIYILPLFMNEDYDHVCSAGFYCDGGDSEPNNINKKCSAGHFCELKSIDQFGRQFPSDDPKECKRGYYCPENSKSGFGETPMEEFYHDCSPGYYCVNGSTGPIGQTTNSPFPALCRAGHFCPPNSWNDKGGTVDDPDPKLCLEGHYCPKGSSKEFGEGVCDEGYYCPSGSTNSQYELCPIGHYCKGGLKFLCSELDVRFDNLLPGVHTNCKECSENYFGDECSLTKCGGIMSNESNVCSGRGNCSEFENCTCIPDLYFGDECELYNCHGVRMDDPHVCNFKNGTCVDADNCTCNKGYSGIRCDNWTCGKQYFDQESVCNGRGVCLLHDKCGCDGGYEGQLCEWYHCDSFRYDDALVCNRGNGTCVAPNNCSCEDGFLGPFCDDWKCEVFKSNASVCNGKGTCVLPDKCDCNEQFYGQYCQMFNCFGVEKGQKDVCGSHGACKGPDNCSCVVGYFSDEYNFYPCQFYECGGIVVSSANSSSRGVCEGHGECKSPEKCECLENYHYSKRCDVTTCHGEYSNLTDTCGKYGKCVDHEICSCEDYYYGSRCNTTSCFGELSNETVVCGGHGKCHSYNDCACIGTEYFGENCDLWECYGSRIDGPTEGVCHGQGTCVKPNTCQCEENFHGEQCELFDCFEIVWKDPKVCSGNGVCQAHDDCRCSVGYYGDTCSKSLILAIFLPMAVVCGVGSMVSGSVAIVTTILFVISCVVFLIVLGIRVFLSERSKLDSLRIDLGEGITNHFLVFKGSGSGGYSELSGDEKEDLELQNVEQEKLGMSHHETDEDEKGGKRIESSNPDPIEDRNTKPVEQLSILGDVESAYDVVQSIHSRDLLDNSDGRLREREEAEVQNHLIEYFREKQENNKKVDFSRFVLKFVESGAFSLVFSGSYRDYWIAFKIFKEEMGPSEIKIMARKESLLKIPSHKSIVPQYYYIDDCSINYSLLPEHPACEDRKDVYFTQRGFVAMRLYHYGTLSRYCHYRKQHKSIGAFEMKELFEIVYSILEGVIRLNERGIVHRDIHPGNIFICKGRISIGDFGLCLEFPTANKGEDPSKREFKVRPEDYRKYLLSSAQSLSSESSFMLNTSNVGGAHGYVAPELIEEIRRKDVINFEKSDLYSVGRICVYMIWVFSEDRSLKYVDIEENLEKYIKPDNEWTTEFRKIIYGLLEKGRVKRVGFATLEEKLDYIKKKLK